MERLFRNREDSGKRLAKALAGYAKKKPVVLALPRGGVPVGYEIAKALGAPLDLVLVRKIGAPGQKELAVAAVVDGQDAEVVINEEVADLLQLSADYVDKEATRQLEEIERRRRLYFGARPRVALAGRTAIIVDDGIATGATVRAALRAVRRAKPAALVLAVPVAPLDTLEMLKPEVDDLVCLAAPAAFGALSLYYDDFTQVDDEAVTDMLRQAASEAHGGKLAAG